MCLALHQGTKVAHRPSVTKTNAGKVATTCEILPFVSCFRLICQCLGYTHDEMLADENINAVYAPLPSGMRNDYIRRAISAGKHVYSEKPMGGTVQEVVELTQACADAGLQWMDGTMWYHSTRTKEIEGKLRGREIGNVSHVTASFTFKAPDEEWLNGGNGRTDKSREPMGCLGDQGEQRRQSHNIL
jgi:predicted dehydrogenase